MEVSAGVAVAVAEARRAVNLADEAAVEDEAALGAAAVG